MPSRSLEALGTRLLRWRHRLSVPQFTVITGALLIAAGTLLLASPLCSTDDVGLWQALFTVTSALTVTGLSIIDVGKDLTFFGQVTLASLIVVGGLGLMAITTFCRVSCRVAPVCGYASTRAGPSMNSASAASVPPLTRS